MYDEMIEQMTQAVFATMFELELVRCDDAVIFENDCVTAAVKISGAWSGEVLITMAGDLSRCVTARMLNLDPDSICGLDQNEVALEIANTIGGNMKSILPAPSQLSLPVISNQAQAGECLQSVQFTSSAGHACISLSPRKDTTKQTNGWQDDELRAGCFRLGS